MKILRVAMMAALPFMMAGCLDTQVDNDDARGIPVPDPDPEDEPCVEEDCPPALIEPGDCEGEIVVECVDFDGVCVWEEECVEPEPEDEPCVEEDCPPALIEPGDCEGEIVVECVALEGMCVWEEECVEPEPEPEPEPDPEPPCSPDLHIGSN